MIRPTASSVVPLLLLAKLAAGIGCNTHSYTTCDDGIVHWFDPEDGQICDPLDCGGGRAPPKKNPGCAGYTGTEVRTISYLSCWKASATEGFVSAEPTTEAEVETETDGESDTQPAETESSESSPSTTTTVDSSTATSAAATTSAATLSTQTQNSTENETSTAEEGSPTEETPASGAGNEASSASNEASTGGNEASTPTATPNAGQLLRGSAAAVLGFAIGAIAFV
ncbi:hypothetical protein N0V84_012523 [Fusarium piperis]|uniref:Siderophore biosynthesis n=1 Tax=Fusarium piperis TaxID=1435070 RepID=A0A9W8TBT6_9HYPO|nr:hypothetical protein N0V84_012523 [Fusarium piperis]